MDGRAGAASAASAVTEMLRQRRSTGGRRCVARPRSAISGGFELVELNVARGLLRDAVSGRDRIPYLHECPLGRVGLLAGAERGVVGARLAGPRAAARLPVAGPG